MEDAYAEKLSITVEKATQGNMVTSYKAPVASQVDLINGGGLTGMNFPGAGAYFTTSRNIANTSYASERRAGVFTISMPESIFHDLVECNKIIHDRWESDSFVVRPSGLDEFRENSIITHSND